MMKPETIKELQGPLNSAHVSQRDGAGGKKLDYLESWFIISEANRIFGHDGWSSKTTRLEHIGTIKNEKGKFVVGYRSTVLVSVDEVEREGSGFGNGTDGNEINAHELALKESESDARKRALMTFGNPFGLALYDKQRTNVVEIDDAKELFFKQIADTIDQAKDGTILLTWWNSDEQKQARKDFGLSQTEADYYKDAIVKKRDKLRIEKPVKDFKPSKQYLSDNEDNRWK